MIATADPFDGSGGLQPALRQSFLEITLPSERGDTAVIDYITRVAYPYTVTAVGVTDLPTGLISSSFTTSGDCATTSVGADCAQTHRLTITDDGACSLDGVYQLDLEYGCHPSATAAECAMLDPSWVGFTGSHGGNLSFGELPHCSPWASKSGSLGGRGARETARRAVAERATPTVQSATPTPSVGDVVSHDDVAVAVYFPVVLGAPEPL
jgi:hypothetical protein